MLSENYSVGQKLALLNGVKRLLSDPKHWTKETYARDANGLKVDELGDNACSWCIAGAARKVAREEVAIPTYNAETVITNVLRDEAQCIDEAVHKFNDAPTTTHEDVMNALTCAIKKLEDDPSYTG